LQPCGNQVSFRSGREKKNGQEEDCEKHIGSGVREDDFKLTDFGDRKKIMDLELLNRIHCPSLRFRQHDQQPEDK
jgi:hypothetical protein